MKFINSMDYRIEIQKLENKVYKNMGKHSQLVIDLIQNFQMDFFYREEDEPVERDEIGAQRYHVTLILEIIDKSRKDDISIIVAFDKILGEWYQEIEFINKVLGIPLYKGQINNKT